MGQFFYLSFHNAHILFIFVFFLFYHVLELSDSLSMFLNITSLLLLTTLILIPSSIKSFSFMLDLICHLFYFRL